VPNSKISFLSDAENDGNWSQNSLMLSQSYYASFPIVKWSDIVSETTWLFFKLSDTYFAISLLITIKIFWDTTSRYCSPINTMSFPTKLESSTASQLESQILRIIKNENNISTWVCAWTPIALLTVATS